MMKRTSPDTRNAQTLVEWFADAGLSVEIVEHCPDTTCERCGHTLDRAA